MSLTVRALVFYPIKSCGGTALAAAEIGPRGIVHDREFMVVDTRGEFRTQRELPRLALIRPRLENAPGDGNASVGETLHLTAPGMPLLVVPVRRVGEERRVVVWSDTCRAIDQGDPAARWLTAYLGTDCRLVRLADDFVRRVDSRYAIGAGDHVSFVDGYPLLLASEESLAELNARLATPLPMNRFRPNVVVGGSGEPWLEDRVRTLRIGGIVFHVVKPCSRCATTTVDQETAQTGPEPLATLATFRRRGTKVFFGQNLIHAGPGVIRVGDAVEVLEWQQEADGLGG